MNSLLSGKRTFFCLLTLAGIFFSAGCVPSENENRLLTYIDDSGKRRPVQTIQDWQIRRSQIIDSMEAVMGELPVLHNLPDFDIQLTDSTRENGYTRYSIIFTVAENEKLSAFLYIPAPVNTNQKFPAVLALHETDSIGKKSVDGQGSNKNLGYGRELAQQGYVVVAPDYPGFGDLYHYDFTTDRYQSATMKAVFNHMRCIDLLGTLPTVDTAKIGVIGHSLGGHNAMFLGAFDQRVKVIVSNCGWTPFTHYDIGDFAIQRYGGRLGPWAQDKYMPLIRDKYQLDVKRIPFDFPEVIASFAPRAFFSGSPLNDRNFDVKGVQSGINEAREIYKLFNRENQLQVRYPECGHDFPPEIRREAYRFMDSVLGK